MNLLTMLCYFNNLNELKERLDGSIDHLDPINTFLWRGTLPGLLELEESIIVPYFQSYVQTYIERDIRALEDIRELGAFDRFLGLTAALTAQEVNASHLGREVGISPQTARKWLDLMIGSYQWLELQAYHGNTLKRISNKRKGYWRNTGLVCYLQRIATPESLARHPILGSLFETWAVNFIHQQLTAVGMPPMLYHWRTGGGAEVDIILERDGFLYPIEVKCKSFVTRKDLRGLNAFRDTYPKEKIQLAVVIYAGKEFFFIDENTLAIPWNIKVK